MDFALELKPAICARGGPDRCTTTHVESYSLQEDLAELLVSHGSPWGQAFWPAPTFHAVFPTAAGSTFGVFAPVALPTKGRNKRSITGAACRSATSGRARLTAAR